MGAGGSHDALDTRLWPHVIAPLRNGPNDPTTFVNPEELWRATLTPDGPGTIHIIRRSPEPDVAHLDIETWGPGGDWLGDRAQHLVGEMDSYVNEDSDRIVPVHQAVTEAQRHFGRLKLCASLTPYHELIPAVLGQRITAAEAVSQWRRLVHTFGDAAPGPMEALRLPPDPARIARSAYYDFHSFGIERRRADTLRAVAKHFDWLNTQDSDAESATHERTARLRIIPGVGEWTSAVAGGIAFGDPDALLVGDFHVKNTVAYALTGRIRGTDEEMCNTLTPYAGHRHRVVRWLQLMGWSAPARGPRRRNVSIARL